jgi:hypothetical protein
MTKRKRHLGVPRRSKLTPHAFTDGNDVYTKAPMQAAWRARAEEIKQAGGQPRLCETYDYRTGLYIMTVAEVGDFDSENPARLLHVLPTLRALINTAIVEQSAEGPARSAHPLGAFFYALRDISRFELALQSLRETNLQDDINSAYDRMCRALMRPPDNERTHSVVVLSSKQIDLSDPHDKQGAAVAVDMMWDDDKRTGLPPRRIPVGPPRLVGVCLARFEQGDDTCGINPIFVRKDDREDETFWLPSMSLFVQRHPKVEQKEHNAMVYLVVELITAMRDCFRQGAAEKLED